MLRNRELWGFCLCLALSFGAFAGSGCEPSVSKEPPVEPSSTTEPKAPTEPKATAEPTSDAAAPEPRKESPPPTNLDLDMKAQDFDCILNWKKVHRYRITNKLGLLDQALAVANSPTGGTFPVGTVIQLVPQEAMVKRKKGWNPKTNDWEFFFLKVSKDGTTIVTRGTDEVKNQFGGNCFSCHAKADEKWDLICGDNHGCDPLPLSPKLLENLQNSDPRCEP